MKKPLNYDRCAESKQFLRKAAAPRMEGKQKNAGLYKKRKKG